MSVWPEFRSCGLERLAFCITLYKASLKCDLFNIGHFDYLQHTHTHTELLASFPLRVGPERIAQAGIEE